jgi:DNA mismatch repair protein MutS2
MCFTFPVQTVPSVRIQMKIAMHDQAFRILEYDQVRALVRRGAQTWMGQALVDGLAPVGDRIALDKSLAAIAQCVQLRSRGVSWTFSELADPSPAIARLKVEGAALDPLAILEIARLAEQVMSARASILAERDESPALWEIVADLPGELNSLAARISGKIFPSGELDDRASPELARIRHDITRLRSNITRSLESLMKRSEDAVQDELVTIRNDRFVIPVKADHRARIQGVAHGYSSSGATAFVEPMETVEANNELQTLRELEQREIARILFSLTEELRANLPGIEMAAAAVAELDFINAKAIFHQRFRCVIPQIASHAGTPAALLELSEARHPLLEENLRASGGEVVPTSLSLNDEHDSMVISGANAGGKTVVLKTAGLLSLMALSGLPLPAKAATIPFYKTILADIGDHQSLAANLSTFTSHISNISQMMKLCEAPALVLLDEVGTGTDPEEGSALGIVVVDHFRKACAAQVIATTHYSGLKMYAANEDGVLNASVEFDEKTLQPTYRLIIGVAGASSGLEIARRFGVPNQIVDQALTQVKDSSRQAAEYLSRIKREADEARSLRVALEEERAAVAEKFASLEMEASKREVQRQNDFQRELEQASARFDERAKQLIAAVEEQADRLKVEREAQKRAAELKREAYKTASATRSKESSDRAVQVIRDGKPVTKHVEETSVRGEHYRPVAGREIVSGDKVRLRSFGSIGIVDQVKGGEAEVRVKSVRLREKLENLELVEAVPQKPEGGRFSKLKPTRNVEVQKTVNEGARAELNVIGRTTDEAVDAVDKFLDEAFLNSFSEVRIIHGHGTGALRRAISDFLSEHPHVERFQQAPPNQGGAGATVVELRA